MVRFREIAQSRIAYPTQICLWVSACFYCLLTSRFYLLPPYFSFHCRLHTSDLASISILLKTCEVSTASGLLTVSAHCRQNEFYCICILPIAQVPHRRQHEHQRIDDSTNIRTLTTAPTSADCGPHQHQHIVDSTSISILPKTEVSDCRHHQHQHIVDSTRISVLTTAQASAADSTSISTLQKTEVSAYRRQHRY